MHACSRQSHTASMVACQCVVGDLPQILLVQQRWLICYTCRLAAVNLAMALALLWQASIVCIARVHLASIAFTCRAGHQ